MNNLKNLKGTHEVVACQRFLSIYNETQNSDIKIIRLGNPNEREPDCICSNDFAIELAGVYDNSYQAEKVWSVPRGRDVGQQPNQNLFSLDNLPNEIGIKLSKLNAGNYSGFTGRIILVCNLHSPLLPSKEIEEYVKAYVPFYQEGHFEKHFYQIWISWKADRAANWEIKRLE